MKEIIANSPKHGNKIILVDDEDYHLLSRLKWCIVKDNNTFYAQFTIGFGTKNGKRLRKQLLMHRLILGVTSSKGELVDHKDRNGLNNQKANIRICTQSQNTHNASKRKNSTSKYQGVCWSAQRRKWMAFLQYNGQTNNIGFYVSEIEAAKARDLKSTEFYGSFATLNFTNA